MVFTSVVFIIVMVTMEAMIVVGRVRVMVALIPVVAMVIVMVVA